MSNSPIIWNHPSCGNSNAVAIAIEPFSARGMQRIYGRTDHFPGHPSFNLDIWQDRKGQLRARFGSRGNEVDNEAWAIEDVPVMPPLSGSSVDEQWVPDCLRQRYGAWVLTNL
jgi:hypothetical protein